MEESNNKTDNLEGMTKEEIHKRGSLLAASLTIETIIDNCLCDYFIPNDREKNTEFYYLFLCSESCTYFNKFKCLKSLYEYKYTDFNEKYNEIIKKANKKLPDEEKIPPFNKRLEDFISIRNKIAHRKIGNSTKAINSYNKEGLYLEMGLSRTESDHVEKKYLNDAYVEQLLSDIFYLSGALLELHNMIKKDQGIK